MNRTTITQHHSIGSAQIQAMDKRFRTQFINSVVGYKGVHLVGTESNQGQRNLSIVSSVCHLGSNPPLLSLIIRPASVPRHTLQNIMDTGFYTLNHITQDTFKQAHQSSARYDANISEFEAVGLEHSYHSGFLAPFVSRSPLQIGMALEEVIHLKCNNTQMVIGRIQHVNVKESAIGDDGYIDIDQLGSLCVSGLDSYHSAQQIARLPYAKT
ncbi:flavin reductase family protein [Marinagarivorans algicola]|uniref:flavin reductase family protein n=1 Tax=Marinagarivorans algicola TaxID=1513270 RepID=UPI0006B525C9|nr:flavin reductase [Marinagarivorans algicola]